MRSWLSNPMVTFIGFLASVITIAQCSVSVARRMYRMSKDGNPRIWVALISMAVVVAISPFEWSAIMAQATKGGNGGVLAVMYVFMVSGFALASAGVLLVGAIEEQKFQVLPCFSLVGCLAVAALMYIAQHGMPGLGSYAAIAAPGVVTLMLLPIMLGRLLPHPRT